MKCETSTDAPSDVWALGFELNSLIPTRLPGFDQSVLAYGPVLGVPLWGNSLVVHVGYGGEKNILLLVSEVGYRLVMASPFLRAYATAGAHFLRYSVNSASQNLFGGFLGLGFLFPMSERFEIKIGMKAIQQSEPMLSFGGGFHVRL